MAIRIVVEKNKNETSASLLRRFNKRVQGSKIIRRAKSLRFWDRQQSEFTKKKRALKRLQRREEYNRLVKLGKISDVRPKKFS